MCKLAYVVIFALLALPAQAQGLKGAAQRNDVNNPNKQSLTILAPAQSSLMDKFYATSEADLLVAKAYAEFAEDISAVTCYDEWLKQVQGIKALREKYPDADGVQIITAFQKARNLVKRLDTDSPLKRACAALAADAKSDVKSIITGIVSGAALKALTGGLIP